MVFWKRKRYDPESGTQLSQFARLRIRGAILDAIRSGLGPYGRRHYNMLRQKLVNHIKSSRDTVDHLSKPAPSIKDVGINEVNDLAQSLLTNHPVMPIPDDAETTLAWEQEMQLLRQALEELNTLDKKVVRAVYDFSLRDDNAAQLAKREGIHRSSVSRRHRSALGRLRDIMRRLRGKTIELHGDDD